MNLGGGPASFDGSFVLKLDSDGNHLWSRVFGKGNASDISPRVEPAVRGRDNTCVVRVNNGRLEGRPYIFSPKVSPWRGWNCRRFSPTSTRST